MLVGILIFHQLLHVPSLSNKLLKIIKSVIGLLILDLIGLIYMYFILKYYIESPNANFMYVIEVGFLPFIVKDLISTVLAALIAIRVEPIVANDNEKVNYIFENEK